MSALFYYDYICDMQTKMNDKTLQQNIFEYFDDEAEFEGFENYTKKITSDNYVLGLFQVEFENEVESEYNIYSEELHSSDRSAIAECFGVYVLECRDLYLENLNKVSQTQICMKPSNTTANRLYGSRMFLQPTDRNSDLHDVDYQTTIKNGTSLWYINEVKKWKREK